MHRVLALIVVLFGFHASGAASLDKLAFWNEQRKGANGDAGADPDAWFLAAHEMGIEYVRLAPANWPSADRDFLLGDADNFQAIPSEDLQKLTEVLDLAELHEVKVVLTMFSLPGARWRQHNNDQFDYRLWTDERYQRQALDFWRELARSLKDHPAVVAYNPLNEPHPARKDGFEADRRVGFESWLAENRGSTADLNRFNRRVVEAIRGVDLQTPVLLDGWFHASPEGIGHVEPVEDDRVLYSFHFYTPWNFTTFRVNKDRFSYPGAMPVGGSGKTGPWTKDDLHGHLQPVLDWAARLKMPATRIVAAEFGCDRRVQGAKEYLRDLISILNEQGWHWAYYSFRSTEWDGMDYELGTEKLGGKYWQAREAGTPHEALITRGDNPLWQIFRNEFVN